MRVLLAALLISGCVTSRPDAPEPTPLAGTEWRAASAPDATLAFGTDGRVSGSTGCNRFSGPYTTGPDGALEVGPLGVTKRMCPPEQMEQERVMLQILDTVARAALEDGQLVLSNATGDRFPFEPDDSDGSMVQIAGSVSYLPRIALPSDAVVTVTLLNVSVADAPSRTLAEQTIPAAGRQVPIPFALEVEPGVLEERRRYTVRAQIHDGAGRLLWTTDTAHPVSTDGATDLELRVIQVGSLEDEALRFAQHWTLTQIDLDGRGLTPDPGAFTLEAATDGTYTGRADCNRYNGSYQTHADGSLDLEFGPMTVAACLPNSVDGAFLDALRRVERFAVSADGRLALRGENVALVFERSAETGSMPPQPTGRDLEFTCDGFRFRIRTGPGEIALWLPERFEGRDGGTYRVLGQVRAASGAKYQDGPVVVWTRGDQATLEVDGETWACRAG